MKICKACKKEIDSKATICPYCRIKQGHKGLYIITGIIAIFVIIGALGNASGNHSGSTLSDQQSVEPIVVYASDLVAEYDKNKLGDCPPDAGM